MNCKNCKTKNITKAHYCKNCGKPFTQEDRDKAYNRTIYGVIKNARKLKSYATLSFITSKTWFKALTLAAILLYGVAQLKINGIEMKVRPSQYYNVQYNTVNKEYYITSEYQKIGLNLYLPKETSNIAVMQMDFDENVKNVQNYSQDDDIIINYSSENKYRIQADFTAGGSQSIELYLINE
ncbi:MAG: zinc ribbon domain-containing protein [Oscillospiraceae bacterium]|nr:zinc ribbon domain-containing protein [Oscillospiraceae bacterium]